MCGLFASIGFAPDKKHIDVVAHRGPDGEGWRVFDSPAGPVALGHRRLAIIDLDARALQPMASEDGRHWLIFNGEIYNYIEIREELRALGVRFRTESDAEVLLAAYRQWGAQALDRLLGMFAFAIFDDAEKRLFLARDRFGVKPLVAHASSRGAAFGSEIKQLASLPGFSRRINVARAHDFLTTGVADHLADTMFCDAFHVGPGRMLTLDLKRWRPGDALPIADYWRPPAPEDLDMSEAEASERFRELFLDSIRLHMRSDVRVGTCLSGGLDSSSIVCAQARLRPAGGEPLNAISAVFPGTSADESKYIDDVVAASGVRSVKVTLDPLSTFAEAASIVRAQDEPYGSTSIHAQYNVFRRAREIGVKVMLDGQGADEILAGYHGCFYYRYAELARRLQIGELIRTLRERKSWHGAGWRDQLAPFTGRLPPPLPRLLGPPGPPAPPMPPWSEGPATKPRARREGVLALALAANGLGPIRSLGEYCVALTRATNLPMLLRYEDRNSMAHSIEARVPFLDHRLVEFALKLGSRHKIAGGDTKRVLRGAMRDILPPSVLYRRDKLGFATPEEAWFKGPLRASVEGAVNDTLALYPDLFDPAATRLYAKQMLEGARPFDFSLWRIVVFGIWGASYGMSV